MRKRASWLAVVTAGLAFVAALVVAACELPTHANAYGTVQQVTSTTQCSEGQVLCSEADGGAPVCSDLSTDPTNCGTCGHTCGSTFECSAGVCSCPDGQMACNGVCTDTSQDKDNCGSCMNVCDSNSGFACVDSVCVLYCAPDTTNCMTECADLKTSTDHCSSCETACGSYESCQDGGCVVCPVADRCANGDGGDELCVDKLRNYANCGGCGTSCSNDQTCTLGTCTCVAPAYVCPAEATSTSPAGASACQLQNNTRCGPGCVDCTVPPYKNKALFGCSGTRCVYGLDAGVPVVPL